MKDKKISSKMYIAMERLYKVDPSTGLEVEDIYGKTYIKNYEGKRLSDSYYAVKRIDDKHFIVCDLNYCNQVGYVNGFSGNSKIKESFKFQYGIISCNGINKAKTLLRPIYDNIITTDYNMAIIESNGKLGCVELGENSKFYGEVIIPPVFDNIRFETENIINCKMDGYEGYLPRNDIFKNKIKAYKEKNPSATGSDIEDFVGENILKIKTQDELKNKLRKVKKGIVRKKVRD